MTFASRRPGGLGLGGVGGPAAGRVVDRTRFPSMISGVSPRKPTGGKPGRPKGPRREALTVYLDPRQATELRRLALAAARERQGTRPDVSAVLRAMLDKALGLKPPKVKP